MDVIGLKRKIAEKNTTMEGVASYLCIDRSTLYRKLKNNGCGITLSDAQNISRCLGLTYEETIRIFWKKRSDFPARDNSAKNILSSPF